MKSTTDIHNNLCSACAQSGTSKNETEPGTKPSTPQKIECKICKKKGQKN